MIGRYTRKRSLILRFQSVRAGFRLQKRRKPFFSFMKMKNMVALANGTILRSQLKEFAIQQLNNI